MTNRKLARTCLCLLLSAPPALLGSATQLAVERGVKQLEAGDLAGARSTLAAVVEADGQNHAALFHLGRAALADKDLDGAIDSLKQAVALSESDSMYRTVLGRAYIQKLQTVTFFERGVIAGRALEQLQKAVKLDPANVEARVTLAGYYLNAPAIAGGSKRKAREQAEAVVELDPVAGNKLFAGLHIREEEYDQAAEKLGQCIEARPADLECRYQLAMMHQQLEQYDRSFEIFEQMLEIDSESRAALYQLGRTAVFAGDNLERAVECLETYLELEVEPGQPGYDAAHWRLGMLFQSRGDAGRARAEFETAVRLKPDEDNYRKSLQELAGD